MYSYRLSNLKFISLSSFVSWSLAFVSDSGNDFQTLICHFYFYHYFCLEDVQKKIQIKSILRGYYQANCIK